MKRPMTQSQNTSIVHQNLNNTSIFDQTVNLKFSTSPFQYDKRCKSTLPAKNLSKPSISPEKSYKQLKKQIISNMNYKNPQVLKQSSNCKTFYWSPDLSF